MKKIMLAASILFLTAQLTTAQKQDTTRIPNSNRGDRMQEPGNAGTYTDSSGKYAPYGDQHMKNGKESKNRNKRNKVDSMNTQPPVIK